MPSQRLIWPATGSYATETGYNSPLSNSARCAADDASYASAAVYFAVKRGTRFGDWGWDSVIPAGSTITAVQLEYEYYCYMSNANRARIYAKVAGVAQTFHDDTANPLTPTVKTYDVIGERAWTRGDLLDGTFEVMLGAMQDTDTGVGADVFFDYLAVTVTWAAGTTHSQALTSTVSVNPTLTTPWGGSGAVPVALTAVVSVSPRVKSCLGRLLSPKGPDVAMDTIPNCCDDC